MIGPFLGDDVQKRIPIYLVFARDFAFDLQKTPANDMHIFDIFNTLAYVPEGNFTPNPNHPLNSKSIF